MSAIVVTSREFRDNQKKFLDIADARKSRVFIRQGRRMFVVAPISVEDTGELEYDSDMVAKILQAEEEYKKGNFVRLRNPGDLWNSL